MDVDFRRHCPLYWTVWDSLCHRFKILLGRCFTPSLNTFAHSTRRHIHRWLPIFSSDGQDRPTERSCSTSDRSLLSYVPATETHSHSASLHGFVVCQSHLPDLLSTTFRSLRDLRQDMVGGDRIYFRFFLGMHWQHIHLVWIRKLYV